jgi:hypothetical protein
METQEFDCPNVLETQTLARSRDVPVGQFGDFLRRLPISPSLMLEVTLNLDPLIVTEGDAHSSSSVSRSRRDTPSLKTDSSK